MHVLVVASTFPASDSDPVPAFVRDQIIALKASQPELRFSVLAPQDERSNTRAFARHKAYDEYRFHYFWPFSLEKLAGRGIMPALKANPFNYLLIPFLFLGEYVALYRLTRRLKPDVLYAHWFTPQAIICRWVGTFTKTPFVFTTHASDVDVWHKIPLIGTSIVRSNARRARAFTAVSTRSMAKLQRFFSDTEWVALEKRSAIIPMGVEIPSRTTRKTAGTKKSRKIVFVGRLAEKKGVQYLLPAFQKIRTKHADTELVIGGDGPMLNELKALAKSLKINDAVSFPGYVSGKNKQDLIASSDVYVVPSIITRSGDAEGLPVSLLEGLSYGKVCVATNESGADDILTNGKNGYLIPQKDIQALTNTLELALSLDDKTRSQMGVHAVETAQSFSWSNIATQYYSFLLKD